MAPRKPPQTPPPIGPARRRNPDYDPADPDLGGLDDGLLNIIPERFPETTAEEPRKGKTLLLVAALLGVAVAGGAVWYLLGSSSGTDGRVAAPTIPANQEPYRVRPADPGGMQVPNQDRLVYDRLNPGGSPPPGAEVLLPEPQSPTMPPLPPEVAELLTESGEGGEPAVVVGEAPIATLPTPQPALTQEQAQAQAPAPAQMVMPQQQAEAPPLPAAPALPPVPAAPAAPEPAPSAAQQTPAVPQPLSLLPSGQVQVPPSAAPAPAAAAPATAPAATPPAATPAVASGGPYMVQLASVRDEQAARRAWNDLQARHPDLLGPLTLALSQVDLGERGIFHRVRATGLATEEAGRQLCTSLASRNVDCLFVGR